MTTPTSSLGMSHIQTEFGGSNPIALSEYYGVNANVASSGEHRMARFLGITAIVTRTWTLTAGTGSSSRTGTRYFSFGYTTPELPAVRNNGAVLEISTNGTVLLLQIGGIGGSLVTQTNVFTDFVTDLVGTLTASGASFSYTGSAGNSTGTWQWSTTTKFTSGSNYSQSLTLV